MNLYFAPLACSLATRIALYEAGAPARFTEVDLKYQQVMATGGDFGRINPLGQVPALEIDERTVLTENTAVLQFVAASFPAAQLAPAAGIEHARMQQWLGFIGTELHKAIFVPLLDPKAPDLVRDYARAKIPVRFRFLQNHFATREFALDRFSIVDAYLAAVLNWCNVSGIDLKQWPAVHDYYRRLLQRPSIARACGEELTLFKEEQLRHAS